MKQWKKIISALLAVVLVSVACFQYDLKSNAADNTNTAVSKVLTFNNGGTGFLEFAIDPSGWGTAESLTQPGSTWLECNFLSNVKIYQGDTDTTGTALGNALLGECYYNFFGRQTLAMSVKADIFNNMTKMYIPAGTVFPSYLATGGSTPYNGVADDDVAADSNAGHYVTTEDIYYVGQSCQTSSASGTETSWLIAENTTVSALKVEYGKIAVTLEGDEDIDGITSEGIYLGSHDAYNFKDYIEFYFKGDSTAKTLNTIKSSDPNLYWNVLGVGTSSMSLNETDYTLADIEKIVFKKGCQMPGFAGAGGSVLPPSETVYSATLASRNAYVFGEDVTWVRDAENGDGHGGATFVFQDTSSTTSTAVAGVKTGHSNKNVTFTLSATDYAGCSTNRPSGKFADYNFMDMVQIHSGDTVLTLKDVYPAGDEIYYNLWGLENSLTIALGTSYDTVTKIVIPAGTVFPSATYTGYGAWDATSIPDNMIRNKGGFETTEEIVYVKPDGDGELVWTVQEETSSDTTKITNVHVRGGGSDYRLMLFLSNNDYTTQADVDFTKLSEYNALDNIVLYDIDGNEYLLNDIDTGNAYYKCWTDADSIGFGISADLPIIAKVVIKAGCELPTYSYTNDGASERTYFLVENETSFSVNSLPSDNSGTTNWTRDEELPKEEAATDITKIHIRTGATEGTRLLLFSSANDYGTDANTGADVTRFAKYNTLNYIELETTIGAKYTLAEIYDQKPTYNLWGESGSFSLKLTDGLDPICKVTIKAGCELPSRAYTEGTAETQLTYVVQNETIFTIDSPADNTTNTNWTRDEILPKQVVETQLTDLHVRDGGGVRVLFFLSVNDYGTDPTVSVDVTQLAKYNALDKIVLRTTTDEEYLLSDVYANKAYYNIWGETGSIAFALKDGLNPISEIEILEDCEFPSRAFTEGTADAQIVYKLAKGMLLVHDTTPTDNNVNVDWSEKVILPDVKEETKVTNVHVRGGGSDYRLMLFLSNNDYAQQVDVNFEKLSEYNTLQYISMYDANGNEIVLDTVDQARAYYKSWGDADSIGIGIASDLAVITKVVIKAGCEFPSQTYTNGTPTEKMIYTVANETVFTVNSTPTDNTGTVHWTREEQLPKEEVATDVEKIHIRTGEAEGTRLLLFLSANDYGTDRNVGVDTTLFGKYNTLDYIELESTTGTTYTLADIYNQNPTYNLWGETGSFSLRVKDDLEPINKVTIKAGCEFPSRAYTEGTADTQLTYVVPEDVTFVSNVEVTDNNFNVDWSKEQVYEKVVKSTRVTNIHVRTGSAPELLLFLSNNDYGTTANVSMNVARLVKYNALDKIVLYTTGGNAYTLKQLYDNNAFYNIWNEIGSVAFQFDDSVGAISKVLVKAGCELPSMEYTNGETITRQLTYVVEEDTLFTVKNVPSDNTSTVHWNKMNPRTIETTVTGVNYADGVLSITLDESDYGTEQVAMGAAHTDYGYLKAIRVYTSDTEFVTLEEALGSGAAYFNANNVLEFTISCSPMRIVIPSYTVFPTKAYVTGTAGEMSGYEIPNEKIFVLTDGAWEDVSVNVTRTYGDANGDDALSSLDLVRMKRYFEDGYGMNNFGNCDDESAVNEKDIVLLRKAIVGSYTLHPYVKESSDLTYFMSQDVQLDFFLNDFFKRHAGYVDYVEGEMTATTYRPGEAFEGMFNTQWVMEASTWYSAQGFDIDATEMLREWLDKVPVDKYGYVWNGNDIVEDPTTDLSGAKHAMGWTLPNANHANADSDDLSVYWDFNDAFNASNNRELGCVWSSNPSGKAANGLYSVTADSKGSVYFEVKDYVAIDSDYFRSSIVQTEYAPWLAIDLRMTMDDLSAIEDIYVWYTTVNTDSYSEEKKISVKETAPIWYDMVGTDYAHMLYVPMYTQEGWYSGDGTSAANGAKDIYKIKIEIVPTDEAGTLTGTFALNYVRPSFDTRYSNNNALFISTIKEYYDATGDTQFLKEYITKARKAMNFLMQMYDTTKCLNDQSYLFGHYGSTTELCNGMVNGYWDVTYTPKYDFQSNMYFYEALRDLSYLENELKEAGITVSESAAVSTAQIFQNGEGVIGTSEYACDLDQVASDLLTAIRSTFWNGTRFVAGKDDSGNVADNGHVVWNLQAIESGIATEDQAAAIMSWIDGESDMYQFGLAPMTNTIDNLDCNMYSSFYQHTSMSENGIGAFGQNVQNGGAVMYSSYYDLMSRLQVNGTEDAYDRLTAICNWYKPIANAYDYETEDAKDFYYNYFDEQGKAYYYLQNGSRDIDGDGVHDCGNGIIGLDGEFPESLLAVAAVPRGFFGVENISTDCLGITPELPSDLQHWKIENMDFSSVKYDVSLFDGIVRVDSVEGDTDGLTIQIALDYTEGQKVYINEVETTEYTVQDGKAIVTVDFDDVIVEVR